MVSHDRCLRVSLSQGTVRLEQTERNACGLAKLRRLSGDQGECEGEQERRRAARLPLERVIVHNQREGISRQRREMALLAKNATPNYRLRAARGRMTQEEAAEALRNLAATKGQHPGINA